MATTPADQIATIERGLRRTSTNLLDELRTTGNTDPLRARRLTRAMLDVDRATQDVHALALDAQVHILQDPDQSLDRLVAQAETIRERGKLWMLQTRVGKRTAAAAFRVATQLVDERLITRDEALTRVTGDQLTQLVARVRFPSPAPPGAPATAGVFRIIAPFQASTT